MIIDCHTHLAAPEHLYGEFYKGAKKAWSDDLGLACSPAEHAEAYKDVDAAIVFPLDAAEIGYATPNEYVAQYVNASGGRITGFASVNPNRIDAVEILEHAVRDLGLKGLKLAPIYQLFDPSDAAVFPLYAKAEELGIPIMWHQGTSFVEHGPLEYANPVLLDPVARAFPGLKMIIAHLGHPWYAETACVIRKHPNMYSDMSALSTRPWQMYNAMVTVMEYGVQDKIFFGTDFPFFTVEQTVSAFRDINRIVYGTNLPKIPEEVIEAIIHRDTLSVLGLR